MWETTLLAAVGFLLILGMMLAVIHRVNQLQQTGDDIMSTVKELSDALDTVAAGVNALEASIKDLKAKVASGGVATQADIDALAQKAADIVADLADTSDQ
jgi:ABC-type transporter Mla subunit MlaD